MSGSTNRGGRRLRRLVETNGERVSSLSLSQTDPRKRSLIWNQQLQVALGYDHGARLTTVRMNAPRVSLPRVADLPLPHYILPNGEGTGYGNFRLDAKSKSFLLEHLPEIGDSVTRGTAWITLWDDMLEGGTPPQVLFDLALRALPLESDEQNVQRILSYAQDAYWRFLSDAQRPSVSGRFEQTLRAGIRNSKTTSLKAAYFNAFRGPVTSQEGLAYLERVWRGRETIEGLVFAETDFINMAQELALRNVSGTERILAEQHARIENPDRKARFAFVLAALSPDAATRDAFFAGLANFENRRQERWVADSLRFLNHPLRRGHAERYIQPALALVRDIQRTGDIFFPTRLDERRAQRAQLPSRRPNGGSVPGQARRTTLQDCGRPSSRSPILYSELRESHNRRRTAGSQNRYGIDVDRHATAQFGLGRYRGQRGLSHRAAVAPFKNICARYSPRSLASGAGAGPSTRKRPASALSRRCRAIVVASASAVPASGPLTTTFTSAVSGG